LREKQKEREASRQKYKFKIFQREASLRAVRFAALSVLFQNNNASKKLSNFDKSEASCQKINRIII
jgi:hypothetical protein